MNLGWKLRRLRVMSAAEIVHRSGRTVANALERACLPLTRRRAVPTAARAAGPGRWWFSLTPGVASVAPYQQAADRVLAGKLHVFSSSALDVGFPPNWNREPKSGIEIPLSFGKTLDYRDVTRVGDVKYVWEINRHGQLVTLAQTWHLTGEDRYLLACRELIESWIDQCPWPLGINWTCSLEPAMRLVNWSAAWQLIGGNSSPLFAGSVGVAFRRRWLDSVWKHCSFIAGHLSHHSSANNHLLGELLGLYAGASTWPLWRESKAWSARARDQLESQALLQTTADGVNCEQAIYYHHFVLEMMLFGGLIARAQDEPFGAEFWTRVESMLEFLASIMDVKGQVPNLGDEDGAVLVNFTADGISDVYRSLLATGAVLFDRQDFRYKAGEFDEQNRWLLGNAAAQTFVDLPISTEGLPARRDFPQGGWYVLGDKFETADEVRIVVDAAPLGYLAIAAHGHADALSATLSVGGEPVLVDAGTYGYYIEKHWRDYFRSTAAHNTLRIDGMDQSVSGGPFLWTQHAQARCEAFSSNAALDRLVAMHDGYMRLNDPVLHRRYFDFDKASRKLRVEDELECNGGHLVEQFWHFPAECRVELQANRLQVRTAGHRIRFDLPDCAQTRLVQGSNSPLLGWHSPRFGELNPCHTLVVTTQVTGAWRGVTDITIDPAC